MTGIEVLHTIQFVVDQQGKPAAVQMSIEAWESLLDWLDEIEDREAIRQVLPRLCLGPKQEGVLKWQDARAEWDKAE